MADRFAVWNEVTGLPGGPPPPAARSPGPRTCCARFSAGGAERRASAP
jgi:hypothetical protein